MRIAPFFSINEIQKPIHKQVYHNNTACPPGRDIPTWERRLGTGNYRLCEVCVRHNAV